jgi:hypothetical protein
MVSLVAPPTLALYSRDMCLTFQMSSHEIVHTPEATLKTSAQRFSAAVCHVWWHSRDYRCQGGPHHWTSVSSSQPQFYWSREYFLSYADGPHKRESTDWMPNTHLNESLSQRIRWTSSDSLQTQSTHEFSQTSFVSFAAWTLTHLTKTVDTMRREHPHLLVCYERILVLQSKKKGTSSETRPWGSVNIFVIQRPSLQWQSWVITEPFSQTLISRCRRQGL